MDIKRRKMIKITIISDNWISIKDTSGNIHILEAREEAAAVPIVIGLYKEIMLIKRNTKGLNKCMRQQGTLTVL